MAACYHVVWRPRGVTPNLISFIYQEPRAGVETIGLVYKQIHSLCNNSLQRRHKQTEDNILVKVTFILQLYSYRGTAAQC